jgi:CubicO group peptidase (beta-lactamase class C family)
LNVSAAMVSAYGFCSKRFQELRSLLERNLASGEELGASIYVNIDGQDVTDLWGGYADAERSRPWQRDTIVPIYSNGKSILALTVLILAERKILDLDAPVAKYWQEFATNGKDVILVRHIISHTSGVSGWNDDLVLDDFADWDRMVAKLQEQAPWWPPGSATGYHAYTMGFMVGELVRRTTGKTMRQFIADELAAPLHADLQVGVAEKDWPRVAEIIPPPPRERQRDPNSKTISGRTMTNPLLKPGLESSPKWGLSDVAAANCHSTARDLGRVLSIVSLGGEVGGKRFLSKSTVDRIFEEQAKGRDLVTNHQLRMGIGFGLTAEGCVPGWLPFGTRICFWAGVGGSMGIMDLDNRMTIVYLMNRLAPLGFGSARTEEYVKAIYDSLTKDTAKL